VPPLEALVAAGHEIALVVTRPDKRRGRGGELSPSPVKAAATKLDLPVSHAVDDALGVDAELGVVVAFGQIIKPHVLAVLPMVNLHFSLLPRWRGAAPVERAILAGDAETGVCVMAVGEGLDTGGVYAREATPIGSEETADELRARLVEIGARMIVESMHTGLGECEPQVGEVTYAEKIRREDVALDWSRSAVDLHRRVRVGRAWTTLRSRLLLVHEARVSDRAGLAPGSIDGTVVGAGDGALELLTVQPEGRAAQSADAWVRGARLTPDDRLGT
jgi:methionyl-tRNA formyltransferase